MPAVQISQQSVDGLMTALLHHPVNDHPFFRRFKDERLRHEQLLRWFRQYYYFCKRFVKSLEGLLYGTPIDELAMRVELVKTLYSELGSGSTEHAHVRRLERFGEALGIRPSDLHSTEPLPEVAAYLQLLDHLFMGPDYLAALGAELAVETTAASEFRYFYPGLQQYPQFTADDLAFFKLHVTEEQNHSDWLLAAVRKTATTPEAVARVAAGARSTIEAWEAFWKGMYREVFQEPCPA